jgi:Fic/DOC family
MADWIGYRWLAEQYHIESVQRFRVESEIGTVRRTMRSDGFVREIYTTVVRPAPTLAAHLTFALKHEGVHLEFLARLFHTISSSELEQWIQSEPTGQYARRIGFLYEWLTERSLAIDGIGGNYHDALDPKRYVTSLVSANNPRWRIRDNLPGTRDFCPLVHRTQRVVDTQNYDCAEKLQTLEVEYGVDILMRSAVWLTFKESRASFAIEHEENQTDRIRRFAGVMERRCGNYENPLARPSLEELQREILGPRATRYGLRQSPVFVGQSTLYGPYVDYIAPPWKNIDGMLEGLAHFLNATHAESPIVRASVASFGFVYIHPMADGNGRISRFLVNDVLRRDGAVPRPFILPISATITENAQNRVRYDATLETFSRSLMNRYQEAYRFGERRMYADGVESDFDFDAYDDALYAWRYPDLTIHVEYMADVIDQTLRHEMRQEARYLRGLETARAGIKELVEGPNADIDRIIRSFQDNQGQLSNKLKKEFPLLAELSLENQIAEIVHRAFEDTQNDL